MQVQGSPARYRMEERRTSSLDRLSRWIRSAKRRETERKVIGRISAPRDTSFGVVVGVINRFAECGLEKVDLAGIVRAPVDVRRAARLPRPEQ